MLDSSTLIVILLGLMASWARMGVALVISILFSLAVGIAAGMSRVLERVIIPVLDILQSIPILSFFPLALYAFVSLNPILGPELAAIFLIFTSQVWNIAFGVYEAVRVMPGELLEVSRALNLGAGRRFLNLYLPITFPKIAANLPASWANGLYFLVASEIISVGGMRVELFGIGSVSAGFIISGRYLELLVSIVAVAVAVLLTNALVFLPLIRMSERYRMEEVPVEVPRVWLDRVFKPLKDVFSHAYLPGHRELASAFSGISSRMGELRRYLWPLIGVVLLTLTLYLSPLLSNIPTGIGMMLDGFTRLGVNVFAMLGFSVLRVAAAILLTLLWVIPLTVLIHGRRILESMVVPLLQLGASIPATLIAPLIMDMVSSWGAPIELGALIIIILGIQWYLFFIIYGGFKSIPSEEVMLCDALGIKGLGRFRHLYFPRIFPSLVTGLIVAMGGGWNTLIIAERLEVEGRVWEVAAPGIGKTISLAISMGDIPLLASATIAMATFIVLLNRLLWRRLHGIAVSKLRVVEEA